MAGIETAKSIKEAWDLRVQLSPEKTFVIYNDKSFSYEEVDNLAAQCAYLLQSTGLRRGDIAALQFESDIDDVVYILACIKLGVIINPINPHFDSTEIQNLISDFKPFLIVAQKAPRGRDTIYNDKIAEYDCKKIGELKYYYRSNHASTIDFPDDPADQPAVILNTSGTTGAPKGVVLTNENVLAAELAYNQAFNISDNDMIAMPSGFYHAIGFHHGIVSTILAGSTMVIMRHYRASYLAEIIQKYPVTYIDSVPTVIYDVLFNIDDLGHLRQLIVGGDKLKQSLLDQARKRHLPVYNCYGLTEAVPFAYTPADAFAKSDYTETGVVPVKGVAIRLIDSKGKEITQPGQKGTIEVKGKIIFKEYLHRPEKTRSSFDGEWLNTGDYGHYSADHLLEIDGRNSDKIIRGGENISAKVVEEKVKECQNIADAAVMGYPDDRLGQRIGAFIVLKDKGQKMDKDLLLANLSANDVDKKLWPEIIWIMDALPKTANGKTKKYLLKEKMLESIGNE